MCCTVFKGSRGNPVIPEVHSMDKYFQDVDKMAVSSDEI